jgi:hypothetical protein
MSPRDVTGKGEVKDCDKANTEWNYNTKESDNVLYKSKQQTTRTLIHGYKN